MKEKGILFKAPLVRALLNTKPDVWPAEPIDPSLPFKSQTRRILTQDVNEKPDAWKLVGLKTLDYKTREPFKGRFGAYFHADNTIEPQTIYVCPVACPYPPGTRLWVRETFSTRAYGAINEIEVRFSDDSTDYMMVFNEYERYRTRSWVNRPSIFMPRWLSRIDLIVKEVRVQRIQEIIDEDIIAEGIAPISKTSSGRPLYAVHKIWGVNSSQCTEDIRWSFQSGWDSINGKGSWDSNPWVFAYSIARVSKMAEREAA